MDATVRVLANCKINLHNTPVKAVYRYFDNGVWKYRSLTQGLHAVEYVPQVWTKPVLENSLLLFYSTLDYAWLMTKNCRKPYNPDKLENGICLWFCDVGKIVRVGQVMRDPPDRQIVEYWKYFSDIVIGDVMTYGTDRIRLAHLVTRDDLDRLTKDEYRI